MFWAPKKNLHSTFWLPRQWYKETHSTAWNSQGPCTVVIQGKAYSHWVTRFRSCNVLSWAINKEMCGLSVKFYACAAKFRSLSWCAACIFLNCSLISYFNDQYIYLCIYTIKPKVCVPPSKLSSDVSSNIFLLKLQQKQQLSYGATEHTELLWINCISQGAKGVWTFLILGYITFPVYWGWVWTGSSKFQSTQIMT